MRNLLIFIFSVALLFGSCAKFDHEPLNQLDQDAVFNTRSGLDAAIRGAYDILQSAALGMDVMVIGDLAADNLIATGSKKQYKEISNNRIFPDNSYIASIWNDSYDGINRVNNIFENIDNVAGLSDSDKNIVFGQMHFLRALHYFNLVKMFAGVPIRESVIKGTSDEELNIPRSDEGQVYEYIINELIAAKTAFAGYNETSAIIADYGAASALLARVYLYNGQWQNAIDEALEVVNSGNYALADDMSLLYDETTNADELIFVIDYFNDQSTMGIADWLHPEGRFEAAAWETSSKESSIYDAFEDADLRRDITVGQSPSGDYHCNKYTDVASSSDNVIVLRFAEMYMILAEAMNELGYSDDESEGSAFWYLNQIRVRAGLNAYSSTDIINQASFRLAIENERRLEFAFEGHRFFDLKRTGRGEAVLPDIGTLISQCNMLFPIPLSELDNNDSDGMTQNQGYN